MVWSRDLVTGAESRGIASVPTAGDWPPSRNDFTAGYDPVSDRIAMYGGYFTGIDDAHVFAMTEYLTDTWFLDLDQQARMHDARPDMLAAPAPPSAPAIRSARFDASAGEIRAAIFGRGSSSARVALYDLAGRQVATAELQALAESWQEIALPLGQARSGIYFLRVSQGDRTATARAVVIR